jgi:hypothetical protein
MAFTTSKYALGTCVVCYPSAAVFFRVFLEEDAELTKGTHKIEIRVQPVTWCYSLGKKTQSSIEI